MESQFTGVSIVCTTVCSGADQEKYQSYASLAFVRRIHRWPANFPHKGPVTRKMFPFDDVIVCYFAGGGVSAFQSDGKTFYSDLTRSNDNTPYVVLKRHPSFMPLWWCHTSVMASQITGNATICLKACSGKEGPMSALLTHARGIHRWPVDSPCKGPVTQKKSVFLSQRHHPFLYEPVCGMCSLVIIFQ